MEADPRRRLKVMCVEELPAKSLYIVEEPETRPCSAARGVLVGHRVAEARQQPLLVALHDRPVEVPNRLLARLLEGPKNLGLILCFEPQVRLGLEQVAPADQYGHLAALGIARAAPRRRRRQWVCPR